MGRPGGFFKKLKAKQKKAASRTHRGTKGASKEERRRKHNERVEVYAAKREAEQLAVVSSSSDEEPSTDSEAETQRESRSLRRLRAMLGTAGPTTTASSSAFAFQKRTAAQKRTRRGAEEGRGSDSAEIRLEEEEEDNGWNSSDSEAAAKMVAAAAARRLPPRRVRRERAQQQQQQQRTSATLDGADGDDFDGEDWRLYLGQGSSSSGSDEVEADQELGEETDDADDVVDKDLLMDIDAEEDEGDEENEDEEDEEGDDEAGDNPLFDLDNEDGSDGLLGGRGEDDDDDGADLFGDAMMYDAADEEADDEEVEEEEKEDAFVDDEEEEEEEEDGESPEHNNKNNNSVHRLTKDARTSEAQHQLLQSFQLSTSSVSVLQQHGDGALSENDEWVRKYHLDLHGLVDETPLKPVAVPHAAVELLAESNEVLRKHAAKSMDATEDKKQLGVFFVSPEEYATLHPENVAVLATAHAQEHFLHQPFDVSAAAVMQCPPYLHPALWEKWAAFRQSKNLPFFTVEERGMLDLLQGYPDVFDTLHCWQNSESRREIHVLHMLNHWFKARSVVLAHDALLAKRKQAERARRRQQWLRQKQADQQTADSGDAAAKATENSPAKSCKNKTKEIGKHRKAAEPVVVADDDHDDHDEDEKEEEE
jgi:U3 small nucleolar RNA-associated protein 25